MAATRKTGHCWRSFNLGRESHYRRRARQSGRSFQSRAASAQLYALLAAKHAAELPRRFAMVRGDGYYAARWRQNAARVRAWRRRADALLSRLGPGAADPDDCAPARLDPVAAASMGRADCLLYPQGDGRAASAHAGII